MSARSPESRPLSAKRTKLVIQINCLNEQEALPVALEALPKTLPGIDVIEVLVVDDGSSDLTRLVALKHGARVVRHAGNRGLPAAVNTGVLRAIELGADYLVNTDADNQYDARDIEKLLAPVVAGTADMAYGERPIMENPEFSTTKKYLQFLGAKVIGLITGLDLSDGASGFRALNREAMLKYYLLASYASPLEGLIQMRMKHLRVVTIPVRVNPSMRPSRLFKSKFKYVTKSAAIILDNVLVYRPLQTFLTLSVFFLTIGVFTTGFRIYLLNQTETTSQHLTLLMGAIMSYILGLQLLFFAMNGRLQRANRLILDETFYRLNKINDQTSSGSLPSASLLTSPKSTPAVCPPPSRSSQKNTKPSRRSVNA